jgi:glyoxylase-like metal-dependent hydrolase (beta-lactamase superfamily II)
MSDHSQRRFDWRIVQEGRLKIDLLGQVQPIGGFCTVTLIWPADERPSAASAILVDPNFVSDGYEEAVSSINALGIVFAEIHRVFVTHLHHDHLPEVPSGVQQPRFAAYDITPVGHSSGFDVIPLPGHEAKQKALVFPSAAREAVWVVGDAVLNEDWLVAWAYYWPNQYSPSEIIDTWRSVATILARADVIIPGHGDAIHVNADLLERTLANFPRAPHAERCWDVAETIQGRLDTLR